VGFNQFIMLFFAGKRGNLYTIPFPLFLPLALSDDLHILAGDPILHASWRRGNGRLSISLWEIWLVVVETGEVWPR
jgi:hypothetical protein